MSEDVPGINFERLTPWFSEHVARAGELSAKVVGHGRSNITYRIEADGRAWVLRRPPLSHVLPTAHDMKREFRVISALEGTAVPVPHAIALCEDKDVIGAPFYVMSFVEGFVPTDPRVVSEKFDEAARRRMGEELIDTLVAFHAIDPASVGLGDFGKPEGYIARQDRQIEKFAQLESRLIPPTTDYSRVVGLRNEARQKFSKFNPRSLGQALRISGITPADVTVLAIHIDRHSQGEERV